MNNTDLFLKAVERYKNILIVIPGSPDPDALASAYALSVILRSRGIKSEIVTTNKLSLPQNRAFVKYIGIPLSIKKAVSPSGHDAYIVPDFQTNAIEGVTNLIPCAAHIDHHAKVDNIVPADFSLIKTDAGSTSSLVAPMIKDISGSLKGSDLVSVSTALMYGIQTDTDMFEHTASADLEALGFLSEHADSRIINKLNIIPVSNVTMRCYKKAAAGLHKYKDWRIYGIGYLDVEHRDSIAITADLLLKQSGSETVVVFALVNDRGRGGLFLDASFRSRSDTLDLNSVIKGITATGGGRKFKGAYQIRLDYFIHCPDADLLWKTVESTTVSRLKKARDGLYIDKISSIYSSALKRVLSIFRKQV